MELTGLKKADAAIVGGGLTGLLLGASLAQEGMKVAILDAQDAPTSMLHAAATIHIAPFWARVEAVHGEAIARQCVQALQSQLQALTASPLPYVQRMTLYTYARTAAELPLLEQQQALYTRLHIPVHIAPDAGGCPFPVALSLLAADQALVDVPRWMTALSASIRRQGGQVYSRSQVTDFDGPRVLTSSGCIRAPLIILTTGLPLGLRDSHLLSMLECRSIVQVPLTGDAPLHSMQQSVREECVALCPTPTGAIATLDCGCCGTRIQQHRLAHTEDIIRHFLPDWRQGPPQYSRRVITTDGLPLIGTMPGSRQLFACGISSIPGAMHAASVLTRHILGRPHPEDALYTPARKLPPVLLRSLTQRHTFRRAANQLRFTAPECTHCGGRMRYITPLSRWECPLCASAYTMLGLPAEGPGMTPVSVSVRQRPTY